MLTFTLTNRRFLAGGNLQTIMNQVLQPTFVANRASKGKIIGTRSAVCGGTTTVVRLDTRATSAYPMTALAHLLE